MFGILTSKRRRSGDLTRQKKGILLEGKFGNRTFLKYRVTPKRELL
jgi:hypothetical protein